MTILDMGKDEEQKILTFWLWELKIHFGEKSAQSLVTLTLGSTPET